MITRRMHLMVPTLLAAVCSPFDADAFMAQSAEGQLDTVVLLPPEGDYRAYIGEFTAENGFRSFESTKEGPNKGKEFTVFQPPFVLQDDPRLAEVIAARGNSNIVVYHKGMFLDLGPDGKLDMSKGKNVDLGKLRDAVGQNTAEAWTFGRLIGAGPVMVHIVHEADTNDKERKFARVNRVTKIG